MGKDLLLTLPTSLPPCPNFLRGARPSYGKTTVLVWDLSLILAFPFHFFMTTDRPLLLSEPHFVSTPVKWG